MQYAKAMKEIGQGMKVVDLEKLTRIFEEVSRRENTLRHLPFCQLRPKGKHRFGCLRGWVKKKSFMELEGWASLRWRPLVSFREHRWRRLFSLLSRF